jgi:cytochrome c5
MSTKQTSPFSIDTLIAIIIFALLAISSSLAIAATTYPKYTMTPTEIMNRIKPIGEVHISDAALMRQKAQQTIDNISRGEKVVMDFCNRCHSAGLMHSPKIGQAKDWAPRLKKGLSTLQANAIHGLNKMPARGGKKALTDADIQAAVSHMLSLVK